MGVVEERGVGFLDAAGTLDVELFRPGHHHLGDGRILEERLEWAVSEDVVRNLPLEFGALARAERGFLRVELLDHDLTHSPRELVAALQVEEGGAEASD